METNQGTGVFFHETIVPPAIIHRGPVQQNDMVKTLRRELDDEYGASINGFVVIRTVIHIY